MGFVSNVLDRGRRAVHLPYSGRDVPDHLIVHCCHHKVGTVWFSRVFRAVAQAYGLSAFFGQQQDLPRAAKLFLQDHSRIDRASLPAFRGSHLIRDPRDVVVSAYFYHCKTDESWVHRPQDKYGGRSYQEHLLSLNREDGLLAEIERGARSDVRDMTNWDYHDDRFLELRYEDLIEDQELGFRQLFEHYGFRPAAVERCVDIALGFSLEKQRATSKHIRSGRPGEWQTHFGPSHREAFKRLTDDAALRIGYETDPNW
jgi:hypothetical protein